MCAAGDRLRRGTLGERLAAIDSAVRESREALAAWADRQRLLLKEQESELLAKEAAIDVEPADAFCEEDPIPDGYAATGALLGKVRALLAEWNGA